MSSQAGRKDLEWLLALWSWWGVPIQSVLRYFWKSFIDHNDNGGSESQYNSFSDILKTFYRSSFVDHNYSGGGRWEESCPIWDLNSLSQKGKGAAICELRTFLDKQKRWDAKNHEKIIIFCFSNWLLGGAAHSRRTWRSARSHHSCPQEQLGPAWWPAGRQGGWGGALAFLHRHIDLESP